MFGNKKEKIVYGIVGLGRFGKALMENLSESGAETIVLDSDEEKVKAAREFTENAFVVKSLDRKTLEEVGMKNCDCAICAIGEHMDTSILTTLNLVSMGIPKVISKANSPEHGIILSKLGAEVVYPDRDMAFRLASRLENARQLDIIALSEKINISKIEVPQKLVGIKVKDAQLPLKFSLNIIAIENDGSVTNSVTPEYVFRKDDILILVGERDGLLRMNKWADETNS